MRRRLPFGARLDKLPMGEGAKVPLQGVGARLDWFWYVCKMSRSNVVLERTKRRISMVA